MTNRRKFVKQVGIGILTTAIPPTVVNGTTIFVQQDLLKPATKYDWKPDSTNHSIGDAKGIFPGRVAWAHAPGTAHWNGQWKSMDSPWWLDKNTDQKGVSAMVANVITQVSGEKKYRKAWESIFRHHNQTHGFRNHGYRKDEIVAIKINMNATGKPTRTNNYTDVAPQIVYAVIEQLVKHAGIPEKNIIVYDAKRFIYKEVLRKVWGDFKDVCFMQRGESVEEQKHPVYGDFTRMEQPRWVRGIDYSNGVKYKKAVNVPQQIMDASYLINIAMMKCHSYPYSKTWRKATKDKQLLP